MNEANKKDDRKKKILIFGGIGVGVLIIVLILCLVFYSKEEKKIENNPSSPTEDLIEQNYSFTKEDAINLIKPLFHSDNYSFDAKLNDDSLYVVTITNILTSTKYIYYVDPATKTYKIDINTK